MADVTIDIRVSGAGADADAGLGADDEELVRRVRTGPRPCMRCRLNAQSAKPQSPQLHPHCQCVEAWEKDGSILDALH